MSLRLFIPVPIYAYTTFCFTVFVVFIFCALKFIFGWFVMLIKFVIYLSGVNSVCVMNSGLSAHSHRLLGIARWA